MSCNNSLPQIPEKSKYGFKIKSILRDIFGVLLNTQIYDTGYFDMLRCEAAY